MKKFLLKRLLIMIPMLLGITFVSFVIMALSPVDPINIYIKPGQIVTPETRALIIQELGLDKPLFVRYFYWLGSLFKLNFGYSLVTGQPVLKEIGRCIGITVALSLISMVISAVLGILLGVYSARKRYKWQDYAISAYCFICQSIPQFFLAILVVMLFSQTLGWLPSIGLSDPRLINPNFFERLWDTIRHLILPVFVTCMMSFPGWTRSQRIMFTEVINQDYIRTARSKGLPESKVIWKHAFKNSSLPIITNIGMTLPALISGAFLIEYVFSIPGMGKLGAEAVMQNDYPIIMGTLLFSSLLTLVGMLLSDILYAVIDPRIRYS